MDSQVSAGGAEVAFAIIPCLFILFAAVVSLALFAFWLWMLIDCIQRRFPEDSEKIIWALVIILLGPLGALVYLIIGMGRGSKTPRINGP